MGGNAFTSKGYTAKRMPKETFERVKKDVYDFLTTLNIEYLDIESIKDKTDFGDLDVLIVEDGSGVFERIQNNLYMLNIKPELFIHGGFCCSTMYEESYQIDFIKTHDEYKEYHQKYLSHNDLGNLIGRCVKEGHFKHGHDGLYYTYFDGTRYKKDIFISADYREVLKLLGLSVEKFDQGFENVEDMFKYVTDGKYFKASFYQLENLNNRNRVRDAKRKNYKLFLDYVSGMKDKTEFMPKYYELYPFLKEEVEKIEIESKRVNAFKQKFNGTMVIEWTGMTGKSLGGFIGDFRKLYSDDMIMEMTDDELKTAVLELYKNSSK